MDHLLTLSTCPSCLPVFRFVPIVGMLACHLDVDITFNILSTVLSAAVAVIFTFVSISSAYTNEETIPGPHSRTWSQTLNGILPQLRFYGPALDVEAFGYMPLGGSPNFVDIPTSATGPSSAEEDENVERDFQPGPKGAPSLARLTRFPQGEPNPHSVMEEPTSVRQRSVLSEQHHSWRYSSTSSRAVSDPLLPPRSAEEDPARDSFSTDDSSSERVFRPSHAYDAFYSDHFNESLRVGLSREARLRIKAHARDKPIPRFGWRYWLRAHYKSVSVFLTICAAIWAVAIVFMHYCGTVVVISSIGDLQ